MLGTARHDMSEQEYVCNDSVKSKTHNHQTYMYYFKQIQAISVYSGDIKVVTA